MTKQQDKKYHGIIHVCQMGEYSEIPEMKILKERNIAICKNLSDLVGFEVHRITRTFTPVKGNNIIHVNGAWPYEMRGMRNMTATQFVLEKIRGGY